VKSELVVRHRPIAENTMKQDPAGMWVSLLDYWALERECQELRTALEPFAGCGTRASNRPRAAGDESWPPMRERIVDWFGRDDFRLACEVLGAHSSELQYNGAFPLNFLKPGERIRSGNDSNPGSCEVLRDGHDPLVLAKGDTLVRLPHGDLEVRQGWED
jgi:hypothetical protein